METVVRPLIFFTVSTCFTGSGPVGFVMVVKNADNYTALEGIHMAKNIEVQNRNVLFNETVNEGYCTEYHYLYTFDGKELKSQLIQKIESCK